MYDYKLEKNEYIMFESNYLIVEYNDIKKECAIIITSKKLVLLEDINKENIRDHTAAGPAKEHSSKTADQTTAGAVGAAPPKIPQDPDAAHKTLVVDGQMEDAAAEENKGNQTPATHADGLSPAGNHDQEHIGKCRNGKIECRSADQA